MKKFIEELKELNEGCKKHNNCTIFEMFLRALGILVMFLILKSLIGMH